MSKLLAIVFALGLTISPAADNSNWDRVSQLPAGTPVEVIYGSLKRANGTVTEANQTAIGVQTDAGTVSIARTDAKRISVTTRSRKKNALIGMAIGAGIGAAALTIGAKAGDIDFRHAWIAAGGAVVGAGAGAGVGALTAGPVTIYRAP
jgi:hypothetical protein